MSKTGYILVNDVTMASNYDSEWIAVQPMADNVTGKMSIAVAWYDVTGTKDGVVNLYVTSDPTTPGTKAGSLIIHSTAAPLGAIPIDSATNLTDCPLFNIDATFAFIKVVYTKNSITAGNLRVIVQQPDEG